MAFLRNSFRYVAISFLLIFSLFAVPALFHRAYSSAQVPTSEKESDPWSPSQAMQSTDLARELAGSKQARPTVLYVGVRTLFNGGHIPSSSFHGTASTEKGLAEMKAFAETLPRNTNLVIYCGCCPFERCPNIRPAFSALREMGCTQVRVLILPTSFATDWVEKNFPIEKAH
jgi:thiosulfate/3-mercaptopyruvate sulfurtransferase